MRKNTQGPWKAVVNEDNRRVIVGRDGYILADVGQVEFEDDSAEHDARLIAEAPEMFGIIDSLFEVNGLELPVSIAKRIVDCLRRIEGK